MERTHISHPFAPIFDAHSRLLILGSLPSVRSRQEGFYYGHPTNRFWTVVGSIFGETIANDIEAKRQFLLRHGIALWDVISACEISASSDASIRSATANDLNIILQQADIKAIFTNGATAFNLYNRLCLEKYQRTAIKLPSTSAANATWSTTRLADEWKRIICSAL